MNAATSPVQPTKTKSRRITWLPIILFVLILLFLIPLSFAIAHTMLEQCVTAIKVNSAPAPVLGITNLSVNSDVNQAKGGDTVTFNVKGNNTGPLSNGTVTFSTIGEGTITSAPVGSGICVVVSETQATCTGVNLLSNEQLNYAVPVVVDSLCGATNGDIVGVNVSVDDLLTQTPQDANASGNINCTTEATTTTPTITATPVPTNPTSSDNNGSLASSDINTTSNNYNDQLVVCYDTSNNALLLALGLSLLLAIIVFIISYFAGRGKQQY